MPGPITKQDVRRKYDDAVEDLFDKLEAARPSDQPPSEVQKLIADSNDDLADEWYEWWTQGDEEWF